MTKNNLHDIAMAVNEVTLNHYYYSLSDFDRCPYQLPRSLKDTKIKTLDRKANSICAFYLHSYGVLKDSMLNVRNDIFCLY